MKKRMETNINEITTKVTEIEQGFQNATVTLNTKVMGIQQGMNTTTEATKGKVGEMEMRLLCM